MGKAHKTPAARNEVLSAPPNKANEVDKSLSAIYRDDAGQLPDLSRLERRGSRLVYYVLGGVGLFLALLIMAVWSGFMIFKPFRGYTGKGLQVNIDGPGEVTLGQETSYFINYINASNEPLASAQVQVSFPTDFTVTDMEPQPSDQGMVWRLGSIAYGGRGTITIKGVFSGALGTKTAIQSVGTYRPASFNSDFESLGTKQINYTQSVLSGAISVPEKALPGDEVALAYTLQNSGAKTMTGLQARITMPPGFVREASSTAGQLDGSVVSLPVRDLPAGASTTVAVVGSFASGQAGDFPVHAEAGILNADGLFAPAQKSDTVISVLAGDLLLKLAANGSGDSRSVTFGDTLNFSLSYENTSGDDLRNVSLRIDLQPLAASSTGSSSKTPPPFLDWSRMDDSSSGTASGDAITWDENSIGTLERLSQGEDGSLDFSVPVAVSNLAKSTSTQGFQAVAQATIEWVGKSHLQRVIHTQPIIFKYLSDAKFAADARFYTEEGAPEGSGPLPPVVGQATTYRINWTVSKTLHELKDLKTTAVLPQNVSWPKHFTVSAGDLSYDDSTRTVTWQLNRMPADVGQVKADFDLTLTPTVYDASRFADLIGQAQFMAQDPVAGQGVQLIQSGLSTDLQNDDYAKNKGVVISQ